MRSVFSVIRILGVCAAMLGSIEIHSEMLAQSCDQQALIEAKSEFRRLQRVRTLSPKAVTNEHLREASIRYYDLSEQCYQSRYGISDLWDQKIDEGGLGTSGGVIRPRWDLFGTKWGAGSPFPGGIGASGPGSPGTGSGPASEVTYSFMAGGLLIGNDCSPPGCICGAGCTTTTFSFGFLDSGLDVVPETCFFEEIAEAFDVWSAIADIRFIPAADSGVAHDTPGALADIRIGLHPIDGAGGTLAHAFLPPPLAGLSSAPGDIHFDVAESWSCDPITGSFDMGIVAMHEIGHSIGLGHEVTATALMNPFYTPAVPEALADDVIGGTRIYGPNPRGGRNNIFFDNVGIGTTMPPSRLTIKPASNIPLRFESSTDDNMAIGFRDANGFLSVYMGITDSVNPLVLNVADRSMFFRSDFGDIVFSGGNFGANARMTIKGNTGNVGIGTNSPAERLEVVGNIVASGSITPGSSRAYKKDLADLELHEALEALQQLNPVTFRYKTDPNEDLQVGFVAEDVPELLATADRKGVAPMDVVAVLTRVVKEQQRIISQLSARVSKLEKKSQPRSR